MYCEVALLTLAPDLPEPLASRPPIQCDLNFPVLHVLFLSLSAQRSRSWSDSMDPFRIAPAAAVPGLYSPPIIFFIFSIHMVSFSAPASVAKTSRLTRAVSPTFSITICGRSML